jgi:tetratricopeptide (TPR) repeat protein
MGCGWLGFAGAAVSAPASAPSPVMQHYQAYRTALEQGDLALAESEAASALTASVEQNGDAPPTASLAVNLAGLRLIRKQHSAAVEPARQALAIAERHGDASGVDAHAVRLLLGRAELPGGEDAALERLLQAVRAAQGVPGMDAEAYPAAVELATAAYDAGRYPLAREAWMASARFARGSPVNADYARARAKLGVATARIVPIAKMPAATYRAPIGEFDEISRLLSEAIELVHDQAVSSAAGGELTLAQSVYGQAVALRGAIQAKLYSEKQSLPKAAAPPTSRKAATEEPAPTDEPESRITWDNEIGRAADAPEGCRWTFIKQPKLVFPPRREVTYGVGAVVLKILVDDTGAVTRVQVAGSVGGPAFVDAVVGKVKRWRVQRAAGSAPGCELAGEIFKSFTFGYE